MLRFFFSLLAAWLAGSTCASAQKHDALSIFGYNDNLPNEPLLGGAIINWTFDPPKITLQNKKINFGTFCGCMSDSAGHLLFYSNGISLHHKQHQLMENGDSINFSYYWTGWKNYGYPNALGAQAVPFPGHPNQYVMVHLALRDVPAENAIYNAPLFYTTVDMSANNGLGRVLKKNQVMMDSNLTDFVVIKHGNGRDWWVLTGKVNAPRHYTFLIHPGGVAGPFVQDYGPPYPLFPQEWNAFSTISEDGTLYVRHDGRYGPRIYDFDRCTGRLSNLRIVPYSTPLYTGASVLTQDKRRLYLSSYQEMISIDLTHPNPAATVDVIAEYDGFATPVPFNTAFYMCQPRNNGKVYYATTNGTLALHVLHRPAPPGQAADFQQHGITLPVYNDGTTCRFPNYRLGRWDTSPCDTLGFAPPAPGFAHTPYAPGRDSEQGWTVYPPITLGDGKASEPPWEPALFQLRQAEEAKRRKTLTEGQSQSKPAPLNKNHHNNRQR